MGRPSQHFGTFGEGWEPTLGYCISNLATFENDVEQ